MITSESIQTISQKIAQEFKPEKIILFGSYAWGTPGPDSDVDLFVITETENTRETARRISRFVFPRQFALDVIVNTPQYVRRREAAGDFFVRDVLRKGKVVYAR